jgi:hypothetical protein
MYSRRDAVRGLGLVCLLALNMALTAGAAVAGEALEARALWQAFQADQRGAADTYFTRQVTVSGVVVETGMSIYATPNVKLSDAQGGDVYVICVLPRADAFKLSDFTIGERASLVGTVRHNNKGAVVIKECRAATHGDP